MNNIFYSVEHGSLFNNMISIDKFFCYSTCSYSRAFASVLLQAVLFSLMKIEDQFLSQFCKFK